MIPYAISRRVLIRNEIRLRARRLEPEPPLIPPAPGEHPAKQGQLWAPGRTRPGGARRAASPNPRSPQISFPTGTPHLIVQTFPWPPSPEFSLHSHLLESQTCVQTGGKRQGMGVT